LFERLSVRRCTPHHPVAVGDTPPHERWEGFKYDPHHPVAVGDTPPHERRGVF